jgi:hypothetical protein
MEISDHEREAAKHVADRAQIAGWERAISWAAAEWGVSQMDIRLMLDKAADYNEKADPSGRIHELEDWRRENQERGRLVGARQGVGSYQGASKASQDEDRGQGLSSGQEK